MGHKDLRLGQIVYILVFYNISFSWLLPLDGFQFTFSLRDSENVPAILVPRARRFLVTWSRNELLHWSELDENDSRPTTG